MVFKLVPVESGEIRQYKLDMQEAFQKGFENVFGKTDAIILPENDIDQSLNADYCLHFLVIFIQDVQHTRLFCQLRIYISDNWINEICLEKSSNLFRI